jgi:molecular chaperone GrpE|uniref:Protein GrpE n=1 Tax=Desulfobacca acetoxidans TaxID=60893 RepID=A0A7C5ELX4_9BACT
MCNPMSQDNHPGDVPEAAEAEGAVSEETPPETEDLETRLAQKTQEAQEYYDRLLRLAAELENVKKRQEREMAEWRQYAHESLVKELLPILDNLERALEHGRQAGAPEPLMEGLDLVVQDFLKVLSRFGVTPVESLGGPFNPAYHHAVMEEEAPELEDKTVLRELQKGYLLQNRLLRPAMVVVSRSTAQASPKVKVDKTV